MAVKVSESELKKIRELGMARSLREVASGKASPEFAEAVRRYYPKAKYGPKSKAAAEAADKTTASPTTASPPSPSPVAKSSSRVTSLISNLRPAIERRIATPTKGINSAVKGSANTQKPGRSQRDNLLGRKPRSKAVDLISAAESKKKRNTLAQRPRSGKRY